MKIEIVERCESHDGWNSSLITKAAEVKFEFFEIQYPTLEGAVKPLSVPEISFGLLNRRVCLREVKSRIGWPSSMRSEVISTNIMITT